MKYLKITFAFFLLVLISSGCETKKQSEELTKVTLRQGWFPWAGYVGELVAMHETDSLNGINFQIEAGADDIDPVKLVISGANDFGITSAEAVLTAIQNGADLVVVGVVNYKSATCFIELGKNKLKSPKDFEGKKVGILTGTETETIYRELVKKFNLNTKRITEVEAPFDLTTFIATKAYDIRPAFVFDEAVTLDLKNIEYSMLKPEDFDVSILGGVYFTTRKMVQEKPKIVQAFVSSIAEGWEKAISNPQKAADYLKQYDNNVDEKRELASFTKGLDYYKGEDGKALWASDNNWNNLSNVLKDLGKLKKDFDITKYYNNSFVENYHKQQEEKNAAVK